MKEVQRYKRNIVNIWLDYKKAYDSVPHDWILKSLKLIKLPDNIIGTIQQIVSLWAAKIHLKTKSENIQ